MNGLLNRIVLIGLLGWCSITLQTNGIVVMILVGVAYGAFCFSLPQNRRGWILDLLIWSCIIISDSFLPLIFLLLYEITLSCLKKEFRLLYLGFGAFVLYGMKMALGAKMELGQLILLKPWFVPLWIGIGCLSVYLAATFHIHEKMRLELLRARDDNEEFRLITMQKNDLLRKNKEYDISMATLKERNRIAREIHDNVGHLLTRSILQMGALQATFNEEPLATSLRQVSETLDESMSNIRNSVHNLHNESVDLKKEVMECMNQYGSFVVKLDYDMSMELSREIKYTFLAIIQEALNNVEKHSNATEVIVVMREHPAFYQMVIHDNGSSGQVKETGIGLHNMESRVKEYGGTIHFSIDKGFRIFLMVPKREAVI